ncbi:MAG: Ig domain-containing protein [Nitrospira sp.]|nr:Ig domain-containing protein [Nitrospira sp.]
MKFTQDIYPVFEANQVLSDLHLNEIFKYLDEQDRLTRANLIGIGIVCGLEINLNPPGAATSTIRLTRGCGVTSEGYLIIEPDDVDLVSYREYVLPQDPAYPPLKDQSSAGKQFGLWELFPAGEPEATALGTPAGFLNDKAVLLFLELKKEGLRNCSPNNCDDKGAKITATVRRLLIKVEDLAKVIAAANQLEGNLTFADLDSALSARLNLPDVRMLRYDVPNTSPATSRDVLAAFLALFQAGKLAQQTGTALTAAYNAFKPIVQGAYPSNPFAAFAATFGFLDSAPKTTAQVRFLPYYVDFFDDLVKAYDEFRWKGAELLCACCPPESLFPRHLMLGAVAPNSVVHASHYRHPFLASPAVGDCGERTQEVRRLFQRLVEMIAQFSITPKLPEVTSRSIIDPQIRITPSKAGDVPLSDRAIPYYYSQEGTAPLYRLWNVDKSRRNRAHHNLSYRSDAYSPAAPAFVTEALRYDLEPYNFLRIEGHLGKEYQAVLNTLLSLKTRYRLPIDVIALRAGVFDESISVDLKKEECRFQDLESLYDALREELLSTLCEGVMYLYSLSLDKTVAALVGGTPKLPLLKQYAPNFRYGDSTVGAWYEKYLALLQGRPYIDVDQTNVDQNAVLTVYCVLFAGTTDLPQKNFAHVVSIYYLTKLAEVLPDSLDAWGFADFQNKYQDLMGLIRFFRSEAVANISAEFKNFIPQEDLIDHFDEVLFACKLEPLRAIHEEYARRLREVKQRRFFSMFLRDHPGVQHKAGVPFGGTFILVYHEEPAGLKNDVDLRAIKALTSEAIPIGRKVMVAKEALTEALSRMSKKAEYAEDPDMRLLFGALTGRVPDFKKPSGPVSDADKIIDATVGELSGGTVIADFFLPYLCCQGCPSVQFVLPKTPPTFTVQMACTSPNNQAEVTVTPKGGEGPYSYKLGDADIFLPLTGALLLPVGTHTLVIQDSAGTESAPRSLTVPAPLTIEKETYIDNVAAKTYQVSVPISGGVIPYKAETGTVAGSTFTSLAVTSGTAVTVSITDSAGCKVSREFRHTVCDLPCGGVSHRCAYRLWLQPPVGEARYETYRQEGEAVKLRFNGTDIALPGTNVILQAETAQLNGSFENTIAAIVKKLNAVVNQALMSALGPQGKNRLVLGYKPAATDPFGVLWIEHFVCETFSIEFNFSFAKPSPAFSLIWRYTNEPDAAGAPFTGAIMINRRLNNKETRIPALDCSERNQCTDSDSTKLCQGPSPKLKFEIAPRENNNFSLQADVSNMPATDIVAWVWDVSTQSLEPFYEGKQVVAGLTRPEGVIRLTAITNNGCFAVAQRNVQQ